MLEESNLGMLLFHTRYLKQKNYWTGKLSAPRETTDILQDSQPNRGDVFETGDTPAGLNREHYEIPFDTRLSQRILDMCKHSELSLYIFLLSALNALIHRYTNHKDIIIISPVHGGKATEKTMNHLVLIRQQVDGTMTFKDLVLSLRKTVLEAYENQDYPYEKLEEYLFPSAALTHISCSLDNIHDQAEIEKIKTRLAFCFTMGAGNIRGKILYEPGIYWENDIHRLAGHFLLLLTGVNENIGVRTANLNFLGKEERKQLLEDFNKNKVDIPWDKTLPGCIEEQVEKTPHAVALECNRHQITYSEINQRANRTANRLRDYNLQQDMTVGILLPRSLPMAEGILAVWKAGGAYIPLDIADPVQRQQGILADANAAVLLTRTQGLPPQLEKTYKGSILQPDEPQAQPCREKENRPGINLKIAPASLAYVIYTSGSTGKPKGAMVQHIGMMNHIQAKIIDLHLTAMSIIAQNASHTFDISVWQFFAAMVPGGKTVIYTNEMILDPGVFINRISRDHITTLEVVPSYLAAMLDALAITAVKFPGLEYLLVTGEEVKPNLVKQWFEKFPGIKMVNAYGPTEASDDITHFIMEKAREMERVPIGKPLWNLNIYILDEYMNLNPRGIKGEICVSGVGVGRGYLNKPELTAEKFITAARRANPVYKTGDLGRWRDDGVIEFYDRKDHQVKIHGFRIEPGEIERCLANHPLIKGAVVQAREDTPGEKYLCAYIVTGQELDVPGLREYLAKDLPEYMIPSHFVSLARIPLTPNGKIDRKSLPAPVILARKDSVQPRDELEKKMVEIWSQVLGMESTHAPIGIEDNFFDLGGHSLRAMALLARIHKELYLSVPLQEMFKDPTIKGMAAYMRGITREKFLAVEPVEQKEYYTLTSAQRRLYFLQQFEEKGITYNIPYILALEGKINKDKLEGTFISLISRHESLRTSFLEIKEEPVQRVHKQVGFGIEYYEIKEDEGSEALAAASIIKNFIRPFDFKKAPLIRAGLIKTGNRRAILMVDMHHLVSDGMSIEILVQDFSMLYAGIPLPRLNLQYKDYAQWQAGDIQEEKLRKQGEYWQEIFKGEIPLLELPLDYTRPAVQTFEGSRVDFEITGETVTGLRRLNQTEGTTLHMALFSIYAILLSKTSSQEEIVIGIPVAGRRHADLENVIGMFVNTLAMRSFVPAHKRYTRYLRDVKESTLKAFENQEYQLEELIEKVCRRRDISRNPLFDVTFALQNTFDPQQREAAGKAPEGLKILPYFYKNQISKFDLSLIAFETKKNLVFQFMYRTKLFKQETILMFIQYFKKILSLTVQTPGIKISEMELITGEQRKQLLYEINNTASPYPAHKTLDEIFKEQVKKAPRQPAVSQHLDLTPIYNELETITEEAAEKMHQEMGKCCYQKNPYVHRYGKPTFLAVLNLFDREELEQLHLLKTHRDNYIAVNNPVLRLLEYFDGKTNLKSLYPALENEELEYWVFPVIIDKMRGGISQKRKKIRLHQSFSRLLALVKALYRHNLIELVDYRAEDVLIPGKRFATGAIASYPGNKGAAQNQAQTKEQGSSNYPAGRQTKKTGPRVLLLGDGAGEATTGLIYMASYLRRNGIEAYCQWNDMQKTTAALKKNVIHMLEKIKPAIVGVSMKWFLHIARVLEICKIVKDYNQSIIVVVGGNTASYYKEKIIRRETVDYVIAGDGEEPLLKLCLGESPQDIPNCVYKKNTEPVINPLDYVQDEHNSAEIYFSHLEEIFVTPLDPFLAPYIYINTGKGCMQQCIYCAGSREVQAKTFNRRKTFLRDADRVRRDILSTMEYTAAYMYDFDIPLYNTLDYYTGLWQGIDLSRYFCTFYFWMLPEPGFIELITKTFNYVFIIIDLCSLSENHRRKLSTLKLVKPQPTDQELFRFFDECEQYDNLEVTITQISGLPYFTTGDIEAGQRVLTEIIDRYSCFRGMDWGRLHAQPGAPIVETCEKYEMHSYATGFEDFLYYSELNLEEKFYPQLFTSNYPYIYFQDEEMNTRISQYYIEATRKVENNITKKRRKLELYREMTYEELETKSGILAGKLKEKGVTPGTIVGICIDRSIEMIIGLLAILKAGGAYLPLEAEHPLDRIKHMLAESKAAILLTGKNTLPDLDLETERIQITEPGLYTSAPGQSIPAPTVNTPHSLAYVLYTSGSTGKPKGVMVEHRNVIRLVKNINYLEWNPGDKLLLTGNISFDITTFEIWGPLLNRLTLYLVQQEIILEGKKLERALEKNRIAIMHLVPQLFNQLAELSPNVYKTLEYLLVGGDLVRPYYINKIRELNPRLKILHMYGPTENTTFSMFFPVEDNFEVKIPIGKPISNSTMYIIDKYGKLVPPGVAGELCVGGEGLTRGYLNNPELTAEKFCLQRPGGALFVKTAPPGPPCKNFSLDCSPLTTPPLHHTSIYRTGDLARWLADGNCEFLGRQDHQVKIRGIRIELGEIEALLLKHEQIEDAVVIAKETETGNPGEGTLDKYLCAYITSRKELSDPAIQEYLVGKLPAYMVPAFFVQLREMPLTPNGKIDLNALPEPGTKPDQDYISPANEIEEKLTRIWAEILGKEKNTISVNTNFFQLGGHSLKATAMKAKIHKEFDVEISLVDIFMGPTIKQIAAMIGVIGWVDNKKTAANTQREKIII